MPTKPVQRISAWSFSRWSTYATCPAKAKYSILDRIKEPSNKAMERGSAIHELAEHYVQGKMTKLPDELKLFKKEFELLKKSKPQSELSATFKQDWTQTTWDDWTGAWVRVKIDVLVPPSKAGVMHVNDYKTGRPKTEGYKEQLELYAIAGFLLYPQATEARTNLWFLDHGKISGADAEHNPTNEGVFQRKELPKLIKVWERRVEPMLSDTRFAPKPGPYCTWCYFSKNKAGPCRF